MAPAVMQLGTWISSHSVKRITAAMPAARMASSPPLKKRAMRSPSRAFRPALRTAKVSAVCSPIAVR